MKKSVLVEEEHIHDEPAEEQSSKSHLPKLSYKKALSSYFIASSGTIHQVGTCPTRIFEALVNSAIATTESPQACVTSLAGLDLRESIDRWYALLELMRQHAQLQLYPTRVAAEKALSKQRQAAGIAV